MTPIGAPSLRDGELLAWCEELIGEIFDDRPASQPGADQPAGG